MGNIENTIKGIKAFIESGNPILIGIGILAFISLAKIIYNKLFK